MQRHIENLAGEAKKSIGGASEEWGLDIGNNMATIKHAERIIPPELEFGGGNSCRATKPNRGSGGDMAGEFDFRGKRFYKARYQKYRGGLFSRLFIQNFLISYERRKTLTMTSGPLSVSADCKSVTLRQWWQNFAELAAV